MFGVGDAGCEGVTYPSFGNQSRCAGRSPVSELMLTSSRFSDTKPLIVGGTDPVKLLPDSMSAPRLDSPPIVLALTHNTDTRTSQIARHLSVSVHSLLTSVCFLTGRRSS